MSSRAALLMVFALVPAAASAQNWSVPAGETMKLGVQAMACKGEFCLGVGCRAGKTELISISPGGGPFTGAATATVGDRKARVSFVEDPAIMPALGALGTRATVDEGFVLALAQAKEIVISGSTFSEKRAVRFALTGYARLAPRIVRACGLAE